MEHTKATPSFSLKRFAPQTFMSAALLCSLVLCLDSGIRQGVGCSKSIESPDGRYRANIADFYGATGLFGDPPLSKTTLKITDVASGRLIFEAHSAFILSESCFEERVTWETTNRPYSDRECRWHNLDRHERDLARESCDGMTVREDTIVVRCSSTMTLVLPRLDELTNRLD